MPMAKSIVCSGDCYWLLVCSGVLVCSGISTNRVNCIMKHMHSLIVHKPVILVNNQDIFSKSNSSLYFLQVCSIKF